MLNMEYSVDLLKNSKKSKLRIFFGLVMIISSLIYIYLMIEDNEPIGIFEWIYSGVLLISGLSNIIEGSGYSVDKIFGNAYIEINDQKIKIKTGIFIREVSIRWNDIDKIEYKANKFLITKKDSTVFEFYLSRFEYAVVQEIKDVVAKISDNKEIELDL